MRITVIGSGYVGLVSGTCFADVGHDVTCVDLDAGKIDRLTRGDVPIYEPGLSDLIERNRSAGRLSFTTDLKRVVADSDVVLIAVGTPPRPEDGHADLKFVYAAARSVAEALTGFTVIVTKSTVPVGTGDEIERIIAEVAPNADVAVASNPEFLREGAAIKDFMEPDRVVIGLEDERARPVLSALYPFSRFSPDKLVFVGRRTAELIKYGANAFLAMKITFINEMADLCEKTGADVEEVARGVGLDRRIGSSFFKAGPGYGGSCFPKDTLALLKIGNEHDSPLRLVEATLASNDARKVGMGQRIISACGGDIRGKTIAVLGLTFKPNTDDMREAPSIDIIEALQAKGARIRAYDPEGMESSKAVLKDVEYATDPYGAAHGADCVVLLTEWDEFRQLDLARLRRELAVPLMLDLRNVFDPAAARAAGLTYSSIGRPQGQHPPQRPSTATNRPAPRLVAISR